MGEKIPLPGGSQRPKGVGLRGLHPRAERPPNMHPRPSNTSLRPASLTLQQGLSFTLHSA